jgi:hypothetical protein
MMKKLLVVLTVLAMATVANAGLQLSVGGVVNPTDSSITLMPSDYVKIDVWGDGQSNPWSTYAYLLVIGPGSINGYRMVYTGNLAVYAEAEAKAIEGGFPTVADYLADFASNNGVPGLTDLSSMDLMDNNPVPPPLSGLLVDDIMFHCEGPGDVLLRLVSWDDNGMYDYDTQIIHQIPEPATMLLLGLGSLLLRRRK